LTKQRFEKNLNIKLENIILGDPGILAPYLIDTSKVKKKYRLGIVPHYIDKYSPLVQGIEKNIKNSKIINIQNDVQKFIKEIAECEVVVSSAMHALILATALDIPNKWIRFSDLIDGEDYNFNDFYSAFSVYDQQALDLRNSNIIEELIDEIEKNYTFPIDKLKKTQDKLLSLLKKEFED
jgi:exopolysaccharide biosynthesis predicted pyruvyltransferase EpsI